MQPHNQQQRPPSGLYYDQEESQQRHVIPSQQHMFPPTMPTHMNIPVTAAAPPDYYKEEEYTLPGAASLYEQLDQRVFVMLRDGKKLIGTLRSYDQYVQILLAKANLVLENTMERIVVDNQFGDLPLGLYIVRGENVVLMGEIDMELERLQMERQIMRRVSEDEILELYKTEREKKEKELANLQKMQKQLGETLLAEDVILS